MKHILLIALITLALRLPAQPDHAPWTALLQKHVYNGRVDYPGFITDSLAFKDYLSSLSARLPSDSWSREEQLAYWINAYNAFTVKLIVDHYPLESIQDLHPTLKIPGLSTVWHKKFFQLGGEEWNLNDIEHKVLRKKFDEPRIHFAINCASFSCPVLMSSAFEAEEIERLLEEQAIIFINDPLRNVIGKEGVKLSRIFQWFKGDFTADGTVIEFINKFSVQQIDADAEVEYLDYNWELNE